MDDAESGWCHENSDPIFDRELHTSSFQVSKIAYIVFFRVSRIGVEMQKL